MSFSLLSPFIPIWSWIHCYNGQLAISCWLSFHFFSPLPSCLLSLMIKVLPFINPLRVQEKPLPSSRNTSNSSWLNPNSIAIYWLWPLHYDHWKLLSTHRSCFRPWAEYPFRIWCRTATGPRTQPDHHRYAAACGRKWRTHAAIWGICRAQSRWGKKLECRSRSEKLGRRNLQRVFSRVVSGKYWASFT